MVLGSGGGQQHLTRAFSAPSSCSAWRRDNGLVFGQNPEALERSESRFHETEAFERAHGQLSTRYPA